MTVSTPKGYFISPVKRINKAAALGWLFVVTVAIVSHQATDAEEPKGPGLPARLEVPSYVDERFRGLVTPSRQVIVSAPLDGILKHVDIKEGQKVKSGQVLARMDDDVQQVVVSLARLDIERQKMLLAEAEIRVQRIEGLEKGAAAQDWEVRQERLNRDGAKVALEQAKTQLLREEAVAARYAMRAPFDGRVLRLTTDEGTSLRLSDQVLSLVSLNPLEAQIYLPIDLYGKVEVGKSYQLVAESPFNREVSGELKLIEPLVDAASGTFRCVFEIDNPNEEIWAGITVRFVWPQASE